MANIPIVLIILFNVFIYILLMIISIPLLIVTGTSIIVKMICIILFLTIGILIFKRNLTTLIFLLKRLYYKNILKKEENRINLKLKKYENDSIRIVGGKGYVLSYEYCYFICQYEDYILKSDFFKKNKKILRVGSKVVAYVDKNNPKRYYIDTEETIRNKKIIKEKENAKE